MLLTAVVGLALLLTMASGAVSGLRFTSHASNARQAKDLAEAAIETATARLRQDLTFGQVSGLSPDMPAADVVVTHGEASGRLSFHPGKAEELGIPVSLNNVDSDASRDGWNGRVVPDEAVQLVAVGSSGGVTRTVEAVLHVPRFPYVVSSSGGFTSHGPMVLGVLPDGANPASLNPDDLLPGHLASNASVDVRGDAVISGDVEAVEDISIVEPASVRGLVSPNSAPVPLARITVTDYQPNPAITEAFSGSSEAVELAGFYQGSGDVNVSGGIELKGGVLYIDGSLSVTGGGIKGKGAVICTGPITVEGTSVLTSDQQVALLSQGDVTLNGGGAFRGLVYTEGNLHSRGVRLIGALIANSSSEGAIELQDTGAVMGEPDLNFDEGWLYEPLQDKITIPWHIALGPPSQSHINRRGTVTPDGDNFRVEWTFSVPAQSGPLGGASFGSFPALLEAIGPFPTVTEVYDAAGNLVSSDFDDTFVPFMEAYNQEILLHIQTEVEPGVGDPDIEGIIPGQASFTPPAVTLTRLQSDPILQTFKLDFNQFLQAEENLRLLLRVDHESLADER